MKLPEGMITKKVSFEQITNALLEHMDDGVFSPKAICEEMGWDYYLVQHALSNKKKPSMMSMINAERIRRIHALATGGRLRQKDAAELLGWHPVTACQALRIATGKTYEQIRKEAASCQTKT